METLYENEFVKMHIEKDKELLIDVWTPKTEHLEQDEFKKILYVFKELVMKHQIKYALTDTSEFLLPIDPILQNWIMENISIPLMKESRYTKHAVVMPMEFIANLSMDQLADENSSSATFGNMAEARKWLLGKE